MAGKGEGVPEDGGGHDGGEGEGVSEQGGKRRVCGCV